MDSPLHLGLTSAALAFGILGTFYLSAQALGFDNLRVVHRLLSQVVDRVVDVQYITVTEGGVKMDNVVKIHQMLQAGQIIKPYFLTAFLLIRFIINVLVIHGILGLILAALWIILAFQVVFPLTIPIPIWAKICVSVGIYVGGSTLFGEKPHKAVAGSCRMCVVLLNKHITWIEDNTKSGGKTGILGFLMICVAFICSILALFESGYAASRASSTSATL